MGKELFLLVDDQKDNLVSLGALIKIFFPGCRIITALSGIKGIELALFEEPDVIILDINMPQMDGFTVCEELKKEIKTEHIPVIMHTARNVQKEDRIKGLGLGAISFLTKPIDDGDLLAQLKVALRIRKAENKLRETIDQLAITVDEKTQIAIESEEKYRFLFENVLCGIGISAKNGKVLIANETMCRITGYSLDEAKNLTPADTFVNPDDKKKIMEIICKDGFVEKFEVELFNKQKQKYWTSLSIKPVKYDNLDSILTVSVDITERKQAEEEIKQKNKNLALLLEISQALSASLDADNVNQTIIESATLLLGLDTGVIYKINGAKLILNATTPPLPPDFPDEFRQAILTDHPYIQKIVSTRSPIVLEDTAKAVFSPAERTITEIRSLRSILYLPLIDGKKVIGVMILGTQNKTRSFSENEINLYRTFSAQVTINLKNAMLYQNVQIELSERKKVEKALQIERDNFKNILKAMKNGIYIVNQQYDIQYVNRTHTEDFDNYEGKKCYEYFHGRKEVCPWCKNSDVFAGKIVHWEWNSFKNQKTYDLINTPLKNPDGSISKLEIFHDITKRKKAEEEIRKLSQVVETSPEAVVITDMKGTIEYVNQGLLILGGFEDNNLIIGKSMFMFSNEEGVKQLKEEIIPAILSEGKWRGEVPVKRKDGSIFPADMICSLILDEESKPKYLLSLYHDITKRKKTEEDLLERMNELETFNRVTLGREGRVIELKQEVNELLEQLGENKKYANN